MSRKGASEKSPVSPAYKALQRGGEFRETWTGLEKAGRQGEEDGLLPSRCCIPQVTGSRRLCHSVGQRRQQCSGCRALDGAKSDTLSESNCGSRGQGPELEMDIGEGDV